MNPEKITLDKYLTCIYCNSTLWKIDDKKLVLQYCADCANKYDVDVVYLWHAPDQSYAMIWLNFSNRDMLYRVDISVFHKKERLLTISKEDAKKKQHLMEIKLQDDIRPVISPSHLQLDAFKAFDLNYYSFISPQNIRDKMKTYLIFQ